ncbi:conserved hypothetical protein [Desulfamplus magnetovallimortis]|uniref:Uncharacterized protein n=1 Tax=Desulfamplus magnetovallimortis TaxID=1246637 RepID=A0A1W1HEQ8_9BACT|nr:TIGR04372 family glycosyltransferase [Desulfamplus magnetovallimortis]SLM30913.1 conserved hypothetical protein [Desulfamplus magnetovallimortis]
MKFFKFTYLLSKLNQKLQYCFYNIAGYLIYFLLYIVQIFKKVIVIQMWTNRIGHLANDTNNFLQTINHNYNKPFIVGIREKQIANNQLLKIYSKYIHIVHPIFKKIIDNSVLKESEFYFGHIHQYTFSKEYNFSSIKINYSFNKKEYHYGKKQLIKMGIDSWFVCFHARDPYFLKNQLPGMDFSYHDYRDFDVNDMIPAMEYITRQGGYAIRMGSHTEKLLNSDNPKIIDYANKFRCDFMDIWLLANCKFYIGSDSGIGAVPLMFNKPAGFINMSQIKDILPEPNCLVIPKLRNKNGRILCLDEMLMHNFYFSHEWKENGIQLINNSPEDILDLTKEIYTYYNNGKICIEKFISKKAQDAFFNTKYKKQIYFGWYFGDKFFNKIFYLT